MTTAEFVQYFIYLCVFVIGLILGRITMAIQHEVMKPKKRQNNARVDEAGTIKNMENNDKKDSN